MKFLYLIVLLLFSCLGMAQCPFVPITLTTQAEVDAFTTNYPDCTMIDSNFEISGFNITDLTPLSVIVGFNGNLRIEDNLNLQNLNGLENVTYIEGLLSIDQNFNLTSIEALQNASVSSAIIIEDNFALESLNGLEGTTSVFSSVTIINNSSLETLVGLENLETSEYLSIEENVNLVSLEGLNAYTEAGNTVRIVDNDALITLEGLDSFTNALFFRVLVNNNLSQCSIESICAFLDVNTETQSFANNTSGCNSKQEVFDNCAEVFNNISGFVRYDIDNDDCEPSDIDVNGVSVSITNGNGTITVTTITDQDGFYNLAVGSGEYTLSLLDESVPEYFSINQNDFEFSFLEIGETEIQDFCISEVNTLNDVGIIINPLSQPRPGVESDYIVFLQNDGTIVQEGEFTFFYDNEILEFIEAQFPVTSNTSNSLTFSFSNLLPFENRSMDISFNVFPPPEVNDGDLVISEAIINPVDIDDFPENNTYILEETIVNSLDPNDKMVIQGSEIFEDEVGKFLEYRIRFQNTGSADALDVVVTDILDTNLNWASLRILEASHSFVVEISQENEISFIFEDINLPPQSQNEIESQGYILFQIRSREDLEIADSIQNTANIFFDFNPPVITNTVKTTVVENLGINNNTFQERILLFPNPTANNLQVFSNIDKIDLMELFTVKGTLLKTVKGISLEKSIDISNLSTGLYLIKVQSGNRTITKRLIKE